MAGYRDALMEERAYCVKHKLADRVADIDAELARVDYGAVETADAKPAAETARAPKRKATA